jgi:hypothetical protein
MVGTPKLGCNTHVHGSNARNLSKYLSLSQASKNAMPFLLSLLFSLQQYWRKGQYRFCLEVRGWGTGGEMAQTMYTHVNKYINIKNFYDSLNIL